MGTQVAQPNECLILDFDSGHDLRVMGLSFMLHSVQNLLEILSPSRPLHTPLSLPFLKKNVRRYNQVNDTNLSSSTLCLRRSRWNIYIHSTSLSNQATKRNKRHSNWQRTVPVPTCVHTGPHGPGRMYTPRKNVWLEVCPVCDTCLQSHRYEATVAWGRLEEAPDSIIPVPQARHRPYTMGTTASPGSNWGRLESRVWTQACVQAGALLHTVLPWGLWTGVRLCPCVHRPLPAGRGGSHRQPSAAPAASSRSGSGRGSQEVRSLPCHRAQWNLEPP